MERNLAPQVQRVVARREELYGNPRAQLRRLLEIRVLEDRLLEMFRAGQLRGTTHTSQGQEAVALGVSIATRVTDSIMCTYRGHAHALALGVEPIAVMGEVMGSSLGSIRGVGGSMHLCEPAVGLLPTQAIVGAGLPLAAGAALAAQVRKTGDVAVCLFGDGAVNIGAFHEALNLASIWQLPVVFVCENNLYGEYSPMARTTAVDRIVDRAASYRMPAASVDGQQVVEVSTAMSEAVDRARSGGGPTLLEMRTYRYFGHSASDPATYRDSDEVEAWRRRDPIDLFVADGVARGLFDDDYLVAARSEAVAAISQAEKEAAAGEPLPISAMFENVLAS